MRHWIQRHPRDAMGTVLLDDASEQVQYTRLGWINPWHVWRLYRFQAKAPQAMEDRYEKSVIGWDIRGWHRARVSVHASAIDCEPRDRGVLLLTMALLSGAGVKRTLSRLVYFPLDSGWRFAVYQGAHLVYSRFLDTAQCSTSEAAQIEADQLIQALRQKGIAQVTLCEQWTQQQVLQAARRYAQSRWLITAWLRRPARWVAPKQWPRRAGMLLLWCVLMIGGVVGLRHYPPPQTLSTVALSLPEKMPHYQQRLAGQQRLEQRPSLEPERWLRQLAQWQLSSMRLNEVFWQRRQGRWHFRWSGWTTSEDAYQRYRQQVRVQTLEQLLPTTQAGLHWQRLSAPPAMTLDRQAPSDYRLRWSAQWRGR